MLMPRTEVLPKLLALGPLKKQGIRVITGWPEEEVNQVIAACKKARTIRSKSSNRHSAAQLYFAVGVKAAK